jgi:hypothetical protein
MRISVVLDTLDPEAVAPFWAAALAYREVSRPAGFLVLAPEEGEPPGPVLILQRVPQPRTGKNRMHVDVHPHDVPAHVARLEALGGRRLGAPVTELLERIGVWWQVMADAQGNELCIVADPGHPRPVTAADR